MIYEGVNALTGEAVEIEIEQARICRVKNIEASDEHRYLAPGFLDIQVNGYNGHGSYI